jgi:two-component system response regulator PilR (NtrC family)
MTRPRALVVDDEPHIRELLEITLARMDVSAECAENLERAYLALQREVPDLCLTDMRLPDGSGLDLVRHVSHHHPDLPVAVITAHGDVHSAVESLKAGAFDFVTKPVDLPVLRNLVNTALRLGQSRRTATRTLIGDSALMRELRATIAKLARSQAPVFISGESGTGKELAARMIHDQGPRSGGPFMPVNCGAIPADLMESELFGHRRGAFTGAVSDKPGLFQAADGGTLFLDEVAEMPLATQVKLLRAIQEKRVRPVGAENEVGVDVRILSASHRDLGRLVRDGAFREDLYYRLDVITLTIPPLRERMEDVPELAGHILARLCGGGALPELDAGALAALAAHDFPGNVRELENLLERATAMRESGRIKADDLGLDPATRVREHARADLTVRAETAVGAAASVPERSPPAPALSLDGTLDQVLEAVERQTILNALEQVRWNKTRAAKRLGISFGALRYRMQKLGLD